MMCVLVYSARDPTIIMSSQGQGATARVPERKLVGRGKGHSFTPGRKLGVGKHSFIASIAQGVKTDRRQCPDQGEGQTD